MPTVRVNLGPRSHDIAIDAATPFADFAAACAPKADRAAVVTDANVRRHAEALALPERWRSLPAEVPPGEASKSLNQASALYDRLAAWPADRHTPVVAVGGGVVGDLAGFVAATYARGLKLIMVPTTLLAMVDSSVGGKTGVNHPLGKNLIGAFHQPAGVWIDTRTLDTLPEREFRSGLAEVVKYGMILDADFLAHLEEHADAILKREPAAVAHVVARCCRLKADVVEQDEREETGLRAVLNYGHTFAHVFESVGGYGAWLHGEAVAAGMVHASRLAAALGMIDDGLTERQVALLTKFGLPTARKPEWPVDELIAGMYRDKKAAGGRLRFILPARAGDVSFVDGVDEAAVRAAL